MQWTSSNQIQTYFNYLKTAPTKGLEYQFKMAPQYRHKYAHETIDEQNVRRAGVAVIIYGKQTKLRLLLTKRAHYKGHHASQISFPGGKQEDNDSNILETAKRETLEETGLDLENNQLVRQLSDLYISVSDFLVTPFVFYVPHVPTFKINYEVERLITPLWPSFINEESIETKVVYSKNKLKTIKSLGVVYDNEFIWGATAMILSELYEITKRFHKQN